MAFLDNSGDIILDAVLTDTGRHRMARGDFRITKFALGDDEIDYSLYNKNHPSGSAYYDLEILKTPVLESFTNNTSMMKSKLVTIGRTDFLYMPIIKLLDGGNPDKVGGKEGLPKQSTLNPVFRSYVITVGTETDTVVKYAQSDANIEGSGIIFGYTNTPTVNDAPKTINPNRIVIETGIDTLDIPASNGLSADLADNGFIVELDSRLGSLAPAVPVGTTPGGPGTTAPLQPSFIDDDGIASYIATAAGIVGDAIDNFTTQRGQGEQSVHRVRGPRGRTMTFSVIPHTNLKDSDYFFDRLGGTFAGNSANNLTGAPTATNNGFDSGTTFKFIDTFVRVIGMTTGYTIDIPIRYVKKS